MEFLAFLLTLTKFIFSSFWVWLGFVIMQLVTIGGVVELVKACKRNRRVTVEREGESVHAEIENAAWDDAQNAIVAAAYGQKGEPEQEGKNDV